MAQDLFDTKEKREQAIAHFTNLLGQPGWKLIQDILDENIKVLVEQLKTPGSKDETKEDIDIMRNNLSLTETFRNTPEKLIEQLQSTETGEIDIDPFETVEELRAKRKESSGT